MKDIICKHKTIMLIIACTLSGSSYAKNLTPAEPVIPVINHTVENFSVKVLLPSNWQSNIYQNKIIYTLQGAKSGAHAKWKNLFGNNLQNINTQVILSKTVPTTINVVVPKFSSFENYKKFRLLFSVDIKTRPYFYLLGSIPLSQTVSGTEISNNGSLPGNTYVLSWNTAGNLSPKGQAKNAISTPVHPPKICGSTHKQICVYNNAEGEYKPFFMHAMDYEMTPVGLLSTWDTFNVATTKFNYPSGFESAPDIEKVFLAGFNKSHSVVNPKGGGGQICQPLKSGPFGMLRQSYCFDTDLTGYMHQYLNNTSLSKVADKSNKMLKKLWNRDLSMLKAMGVNTIRIYHIDPLVRNMTDFLNLAYKYQIYVIMPAPTEAGSQKFSSSPLSGRLESWSQMTSSTDGQPWSALMQLELAKYAANPAILAWAVGNETNADNGNVAAKKVVRYLARVIKQFDPHILVTSTNQDHYNSIAQWEAYWNVYAKQSSSKNGAADPLAGSYIDFYSVNTYRGVGTNQLQLGAINTWLRQYQSVPSKYRLPLFISEWGKYDNYNWGSFSNKWGYDLFMRNLLLEAQKIDILGSAYFEFSDEPIAKNQPSQHYMGVVANQVNSTGTGVDSLTPKYSDYQGILVKNTAKIQDYPPVLMAGIADSFIGNNQSKVKNLYTNTYTELTDSAIMTVPNISYCAYSQSKDPAHINPRCLLLDVNKQALQTPYCIAVTKTLNERISVAMNGVTLTLQSNGVCKNYYKVTQTGELNISVMKNSTKSVTGEIQGFAKIGLSEPFITPKKDSNTLFTQGFSGNVMASKKNQLITITLTPLS